MTTDQYIDLAYKIVGGGCALLLVYVLVKIVTKVLMSKDDE